MSATMDVRRVSREVLEDRWAGLLSGLDPEEGRSTTSELWSRLNLALYELGEGVTRRSVDGSQFPDPDDPSRTISLDVVMDFDGLWDVIRDWTIDRASKPGVAL